MQIALITTRSSLDENQRILVEARALGHDIKMLDMKALEYNVIDNKLHIAEFENYKPDLIIVRGIFNSVKSIATFVKGLRAQGIPVFDNNFFDHLYSINKIADIIKLAQKGIPVPDTYHLHTFDKFVPSAESLGYPVICKLTRTGKGAGIYKFDGSDDLANFVNDLEEREVNPKSYLLQKFVKYKDDLRILIIGEHVFTMKRIPGEGEFRANFSLGGSVEPYELDEEGRKMALNALHAVNLEIGGVDMLITESGKRYILEVNHTAGFVGMELAQKQNIGKIWVEHALAHAR